MLTRREALAATAGGIGLLAAGRARALDLPAALPDGVKTTAELDQLPGKVPLIKLSFRPPNYETPLSLLNHLYTPNDTFFVRYHLADIPDVDIAKWKLTIGGAGAGTPFSLTFDELKKFDAVEVTAVCQCSGNRRGLFEPHVTGVQWGYGAMGNARWKGVRLKDVLAKAGLARDVVEIAFNGADGPVLDKTPDFAKSLPLQRALDDSTIIAYEMNGEPLPKWNGYPARLIVPGWTATYWVKHLTTIEALPHAFEGFWMKSAYRIPTGAFPVVQRFLTQENAANTPITEMVVNSLIMSPLDGASVKLGAPLTVTGFAWDAGYGIDTVEISVDNGVSFERAILGPDAGRFSWRPFSMTLNPSQKGKLTVMAKATNRIGQTQTTELIKNPAGYHHNLMHRVTIDLV